MTMGLPPVRATDSGPTGVAVKLQLCLLLTDWARDLRALPDGSGLGPEILATLAGRAEALADDLRHSRTQATSAAASVDQLVGAARLLIAIHYGDSENLTVLAAAAQTLRLVNGLETLARKQREPVGGAHSERVDAYFTKRRVSQFAGISPLPAAALFVPTESED